MKKITFLFLRLMSLVFVMFVAGTLHAQVRGNGIIEEQTRSLSGFNAIVSVSSVDVFVKQGDTYSVVVRADGNLLNYVKTEVKNNTLYVSVTKNIWRAKMLEVYVTMKELQKVVLSGSGDFYCKSPFTTSNLLFVISGSGDAEASLKAKNVQVKVSGSGDVKLRGIRGNFEVEIAGSGDVEAYGLQLENCSIKIVGSGDVELKGRTAKLTALIAGSGDVDADGLTAVKVNVKNTGSGDVSVHAVDILEATLVGSGDLGYTGNPAVFKVNAAGSGEVYRK